MDENAIESTLLKYPLLRRHRDRLAAMGQGAFCFHKTFGLGEIVGYDSVAGRLTVDFDGKPRHAIDPAFAIKHLEILPEGHLLVHFRKNPSKVQKLLRERPAEVLRIILTQSKDGRATQMEIGETLLPILGEKGLKAWWPKAKREAELDPQISQPEQRNGYYILREQPMEQVDELIDGVLLSKQAAKKIQCAAKLLSEKKFILQREKVSMILEELERLSLSTAPVEAEKLQLFWLCEDFATMLEVRLPEEITQDAILMSIGDMTEVANALPISQINRLLRCMQQTFQDNFQSLSILLVRSGSSRTIGTTVDFLIAAGFGEFVQQTITQWLRDGSMKVTLLDWVLRNRHQKKYEELLRPLAGPILFRVALSNLDQESLKRTSNRKIPLAETIIGDRSLVEEVILGQPLEMARDLAHMVLVNQCFDVLTKRSIVARFIRIFPSLQALLESGGAVEEAMLWVSQESLDAIRQEYEHFISVKIPANTAAVERAREEGDLRENSEYKMARQDQDMLLARKTHLEKDLARAQVVNFSDVAVDVVGIGSAVTLEDGKGKLERLAILGAWDSDPDRNILSYLTPLGRELLGKKVGAEVAFEGQAVRTIHSIERWVDCAPRWKSGK
ncbi:MAG: GreA/GreB family elongation factor [Puniceicoccales bacterium]|jgi:transcription elongation GreA/GreB family factor|nr:GreA/GreB family elongation factor [Puniceicoccales bacterium]